MKKKQDIIRAATRLFAEQGLEGSTTLQIANEAGVTEPLIYYHFKGKEDLFNHIIDTSFKKYFSGLDALEKKPATQFQGIKALLNFHFRFVGEFPDETYIAVSVCPTKFREPDHVCTKNARRQRDWLETYLTDCLQKGIKRKEFNRIPVPETVNFLIGMINGLTRQRGLHLEDKEGMRGVTVEFCRRSLVRN